MNPSRSTAHSPYMDWAKLHSTAKFNLATSGMVGFPLSELDVRINELEINGVNPYGYAPLLEAISTRYRVPQECVVTATGTSLANYLALAATTEPGDEILVEEPSYDPILGAAQYLGLEVKRFQRPAARNFDIDLEDLERKLTTRTRLIVITDMHNPSGALCPETVLQQIATLARKSGAYVVVDEVYREMLFEEQPRSAFLLDPERFIITTSLTKAYGLSGLRCGWLLAPRHVARRMWQIHDLHGATYAYPAELLSVIAFSRLAHISSSMKPLLDANRKLLHDFLVSRDDLDYFWPEYGTIVFPHLRTGNADEFCTLLRNDFETTVVPGRFFEAPDRFRIGVGSPTELVRAALEQLGRGLDKYKTVLAADLR
ncbi:MAG TPA: pyridoxal phosphate-dependent aminotransferase [Candidatus Solibacter sp.]|nr:pyridoxal phosphate-dependent aminotransferase [Candidatus Solibacter sp.]